MNKFSLIIILCAIIVLGVTYLYIQLNEVNLQQIFNRETDSGSVFGDNIDETKDLPLSEGQEQGEQSGPDSSDSGESEGAAQNPQGTNQQADSPCSTQQISYSIKKFQKSETCSQYEQELCIEKTINCSIELTNLDSNIAGEFEIIFSYHDESGQALGSSSDVHILSPQEFELFESALTISGAQAQQTISCQFDITNVPERQVCA